MERPKHQKSDFLRGRNKKSTFHKFAGSKGHVGGKKNQQGNQQQQQSQQNQGGGGGGGGKKKKGGDLRNQGTRTLKVQGLSNVDQEKFIDHLKNRYFKKSSESFNYTEFRENENGVFLTVYNRYVSKLQNLQGKYNGNEFHIIIAELKDMFSDEQRAKFLEVMKERYNAAANFLDFKRIIEEPALKNVGIVPDLKHKNFASLMLSSIKENIPNLVTVSLSENRLSNLSNLHGIHESCPELQNLDLRGNGIRSMQDLVPLKGLKHLRELLISENDVCDDLAMDKLKEEVEKMFPSVILLNNETIKIIAEVDTSIELGVELQGNFFQSPELETIVTEFLARFLQAVDNNRKAVPDFYTDNSTFSLSLPKGEKNDTIFSNNRNLWKANDYDVRVDKLTVSKQKILNEVNLFPNVSHDLSLLSVDCWESDMATCPGFLFLHLHGKFIEENEFLRNFDRTFVLTPAREGSPYEPTASLPLFPYSPSSSPIPIPLLPTSFPWESARPASPPCHFFFSSPFSLPPPRPPLLPLTQEEART